MKKLSLNELKAIKGGELIALATVMAILSTAIVAVVIYRLFMSSEGSTTLPGGFKFTWND